MVAKPHPSRHHRPGVVLLLALLVMASITATTVTVSVIIANSLEQSRSLDNFIVASLASDSGIERGLGLMKAGRKFNSAFATTLGTLSTSRSFSNQANFAVTATDSTGATTPVTLLEGQQVSIDILRICNNPPTCSATTTPPSFIRTLGNCPTPNCPSKLELSWVVIDQNGDTFWSGRKFLNEGSFDTSTLCLNLKDNLRSDESNAPQPFSGGTELGYRLTFRAIDGDVNNFSVEPHSNTPCDAGNLSAIYSRVRLTSIGQSGGTQPAQSTKRVEAYWQPPASPLLNYVIFTEDSIIP